MPIITFREDVKGDDRAWHGERNITAEILIVSVDSAGRAWVRLRVIRASGHRARELPPEIQRGLATVKRGKERFRHWLAKRLQSRKRASKRRA